MRVEEFGQWYRYLDWLLPLDDGYNRRLWEAFGSTDREKVMPFVTFAERYGQEKGHRQGMVAAIRLGLDLKFGEPGLALMTRVEGIDNPSLIQAIYDAIKPAASLDDVVKLLPPA
jgi:hypothetical protein